MRSFPRVLILFSAILLDLFALPGCEPPPAARPAPPPAPATVATALKKSVPIRVRSIGSVKVISTVSVRPRVGGELTGVHFTEGDTVAEGDPLFTIDPRPYNAAVLQAEANLKKSEAVLKGAELELARAKQGGAGGVVSGAELDAAETAVAAAAATVAADQAAINTAKIQAGFTVIKAPIAGRTGALLVTKGNIVSPTDPTALVIINQISPIHVAFTLPEWQLPVVVQAREQGPLKVEADLRGGGKLATGRLTFIDNTADPETGTVMFKAEFENANRKLWPGLFVDVVLTLGERPDSVVVPSAAVQTGQQGQYVYVVNATREAELKPVTVAFESDGEAVIAAGLTGGESVVVEGQLRLAPGTKVDPKPAIPGPSAPTTPTVVVKEGVK